MTSCARSREWSLASSRLTWVLAVAVVMYRATATAAALAVMPYIHGDAVSVATYSLPLLAAVGAAVAAGAWLRVRRAERARALR
jgi:hypothetical protein